MRRIGGAAGIAKRARQRNESQDSYQIFQPNGEWKREHINFLIAK